MQKQCSVQCSSRRGRAGGVMFDGRLSRVVLYIRRLFLLLLHRYKSPQQCRGLVSAPLDRVMAQWRECGNRSTRRLRT